MRISKNNFMKYLLEHESKELLERYGIKTAKCIFVRSEDEAVKAAKSIGFPVVMKVSSHKIVHKSEFGGVILNINNEDDVRKAFRKLISIKDAEGVNVQPMLPKGIEVIIGVSQDEQFGSIIMFGLGGVFVEALKDVSFRLIPITRRDAEEMIRETKAYEILKKYRNDSLVELLLKVGDIAEKEGIVEMDLNPVFVYENDCIVADARIVLGKVKSHEFRPKRDIKDILNPKSVAVIGASANPTKVGYAVLSSLKSNPNIKIYPINPRLDKIDGLKVYPSILNVDDEVDLAVIALPADKVLKAVLESVQKGVKGIVIISSGFREAEYHHGRILQEKLSEIAKNENIRIIGPNVFGFVNAVRGINVSFTPMFSNIRKGRIALVSQSGGICHYIAHSFEDLGFSYIIHLGNRCDVDFADVFEYLKDDESTDIVAVYVEGIENGRIFYESLKELCKSKYVVAMKSGKSRVADRASLSHTGSLAGEYRVFRSALKQAGAIVAEDPTELIYIAKALDLLGRPKGELAILSIQAGLGIVATDILEDFGGKLAKLNNETIDKLREILPPITMRENPVDLSFSGFNPEILKKVVEIVSKDENVGLLMFIYAVAPPSWIIPTNELKNAINSSEKPVIVVYASTSEDFARVKEELEGKGVFVCNSLEYAARIAAKII